MKRQRQKIFSNIVESISVYIGDGLCVEIGCGVGRYLCPISSHKERKIFGVDCNINIIGNQLCEFPFTIANAHKLPFRTATVETIYLIQTLHQLNDWRGAIIEIYRVLQSHGNLVIHTLSHQQLSQVVVLQCIPMALDLEIRRFPAINDIIDWCQQSDFNCDEPISLSNTKVYSKSDLLDFVKSRANSALEILYQQLGEIGYDDLISQVVKNIGVKSQFVEQHDSTLIVAQKRS